MTSMIVLELCLQTPPTSGEHEALYAAIMPQSFMLYVDSSVEQLNRPSLRDILMEISASEEEGFLIMERWENIGLQLDIADEKLVAIRRKHTISTTDDGLHHDYNQAFRDMIRVWVKQVNPPPTWLNFVKAFECLNVHHKFTEELRSKYCGT